MSKKPGVGVHIEMPEKPPLDLRQDGMEWHDWVVWMMRYGWEGIVATQYLFAMAEQRWGQEFTFQVNDEITQAHLRARGTAAIYELIQLGDLPPEFFERWSLDVASDGCALGFTVTRKS